MKRFAFLALACAGLVLGAREARAEGENLFFPVGATVGYSFNPKRLSNGAVLGGEASLAWVDIHSLMWFGGYADALHDFGSGSSRFTLGPELGWFIFGVDGGLVLSTLDDVHAGLCGRFLVTASIVSAYSRVGTVFSSPREGTYGELGLLVKLPIPLDTKLHPRSRPPRTPEPPPPLPPPSPLQQDPAPEQGDGKPSLPVAI